MVGKSLCGWFIVFSVQQQLTQAGFKPHQGASSAFLDEALGQLSSSATDDSMLIAVVSKDEYDNVVGTLLGVLTQGHLEVRTTADTTRRSGLSTLLDVCGSLGSVTSVSVELNPKSQKPLLKALMFMGFKSAGTTSKDGDAMTMSYSIAPVAASA